jgi:hypothetical protein
MQNAAPSEPPCLTPMGAKPCCPLPNQRLGMPDMFIDIVRDEMLRD